MYYTVIMAVVNYFGTKIPEIEKINGHKQIELAELYEKDDHFTVSDVLLSENQVILTVKLYR